MQPEKKVTTNLPMIEVGPGTLLYKIGGEDRRMFVVLEGSVKIYTEYSGVETEIDVVHKYQFCGENELYTNKPRNASAKTLSNTKLVIIKTLQELEEFANSNSWLTGKMMQTMGERLAHANELLTKKRLSEAPLPASEAPLRVETQAGSLGRRVIKRN